MVDHLKQSYPLRVEWEPFLLHPETPPEGAPLPPNPNRDATYVRLKARADELGLKINKPPMLFGSRRALEASKYAREHGRDEEFHHVIFSKLFVEGENIGQWEVLRAAAKEAGLDGEEMQREVENGRFRNKVDEELRKASELGISSVPTFIVDDKYALVGAHPAEMFENLLNTLGYPRKKPKKAKG